jgi:PadR family transcriptional regulator, regulatory protein AphA
MSSLSPTAKITLAFLRFGPRSGYDIKQSVEVSTRFFWGASFGQIYPELRRLEQAGLVEVDSEGSRGRKVYRLTPAGRRTVDDWLRDDESTVFQYRDEGLLRLFFSDLADTETALSNVRRMREWREEVVAFLHSQIEPHAQEDVEFGHRFPLRALEFGIAWLDAQATWLAELERELSQASSAR